MKLNISQVEYSKHDIENNTRIPTHLSPKLAHFIGIHLGDGHLTKTKWDYREHYNGHFINEKWWYDTYLSKLIKDLFNKNMHTRSRNNTIKVKIHILLIINSEFKSDVIFLLIVSKLLAVSLFKKEFIFLINSSLLKDSGACKINLSLLISLFENLLILFTLLLIVFDLFLILFFLI